MNTVPLASTFVPPDFLASSCRNEKTGKYDLGPWVINAAESNGAAKHETINPAFELAYWHYGLDIACKWSERMGLPANRVWKTVLENLAPLPVDDGVYVMWEGVPDKHAPGFPDDGKWVVRQEGLMKAQ